jgi:hypothetical protein
MHVYAMPCEIRIDILQNRIFSFFGFYRMVLALPICRIGKRTEIFSCSTPFSR